MDVNMKKILLIFTILLAFVISCGKSSDSETLKLNLKEEGKSYDPQLANDSTGEFVDSLVTETLTRQSDDGKSLPGVAEKWEHNADSTVWTFHLRKMRNGVTGIRLQQRTLEMAGLEH